MTRPLDWKDDLVLSRLEERLDAVPHWLWLTAVAANDRTTLSRSNRRVRFIRLDPAEDDDG